MYSGSSSIPGLCTSHDINPPGPSVSKMYSNSSPADKCFSEVGSSMSIKSEFNDLG